MNSRGAANENRRPETGNRRPGAGDRKAEKDIRMPGPGLRKKKRNIRIICKFLNSCTSLCLIGSFFWCSCTERTTPGLGYSGEPMLVVFGEISDVRMAHRVSLSRSAPYFSQEQAEMVSGATVSLSDGTDSMILEELQDEPGVYVTDATFAAELGKTYQLDIHDVDIDEDGLAEAYAAETVMRETMKIDAVAVGYNQDRERWEVGVMAKDPAETEDFYLFKLYKNSILYTDTIGEYQVFSDETFNGSYLQGSVVQYFDQDQGEIVRSGDRITLQVSGITEEYYDFITALKMETGDKYPVFSGPSSNLPGNISNGALGFFAVISTSAGSVIYGGD